MILIGIVGYFSLIEVVGGEASGQTMIFRIIMLKEADLGSEEDVGMPIVINSKNTFNKCNKSKGIN